MEVDDEDAVLEASKKSMAEDEAKRWEMVLQALAREQEEALQAQQAAVMEPPEWWQGMAVDLPPAPPLPADLLGHRWIWNGGS